jgi:hypothetical protein
MPKANPAPEAIAVAAVAAPPAAPPMAVEPMAEIPSQLASDPVADRIQALEAENRRLRQEAQKAIELEERMTRLERGMANRPLEPAEVAASFDGDDVPLSEKVLFLYDPSLADSDRFTRSYLYFTVLIKGLPTTTEGETREETQQIAVIPGVQEMRRDFYEQIASSQQPETIRAMFRRGVIQLWSDEADFLKIAQGDALKAQETIRRCDSRTLLGKWVSYWNQLPSDVRKRLEEREVELKVSRPQQKTGVFGTPIN